MLIQSQQPFYNQNMMYKYRRLQVCLISDVWLSWWFDLVHISNFYILWKRVRLYGLCGSRFILWGLNVEGVQLYGLWYCTLGLSHLTYEGHRNCGVAVSRWKKPHTCCTWYWRNLGRISFYSFKSDDLIHAVIAAIIKKLFQKHQLLLRWMATLRFYRPPRCIQSKSDAGCLGTKDIVSAHVDRMTSSVQAELSTPEWKCFQGERLI